jgi:UPF0755 protein
MKKSLKFIAIFLVIITFGVAGITLYFFKSYKDALDEKAGDSKEPVEFLIEEGESVEQIATKLEENNLIVNELYFRLYLKQNDLETKMQAGKFRIPQNSTIKDVAEILQNAKKPDIWVTIPEGLMTTQIADIIEKEFNTNPENSFDKAAFLEMVQSAALIDQLDIPKPADKPLEGYLYPDTYRFPADANEEYVLNALLTEGFNQKIYTKYKSDIDNSQFSLYEVLILASILERETRHSEDRPIVADILIRRINNNWRLDVDATLLYYFKDWEHEITMEDLQIDNPYNTRKVNGLPPTPIANPGEDTIKAILNPEANEFWYYVNDSEGNLHYATTEYEHNINIQKYVQ